MGCLMAVRATHIPSGTDIAIGPYVDSTSQAVIDEIYQACSAGVLECREHDDDPYLAHLRDAEDGRLHGAWVCLKRNPAKTKWVIAHLPNGIGREFRSHEVPVGKSDQHQWQQDYISRAAESAGFPAEQEVTLPTGTRLDVKIDGSVGSVGFEVQHSFLSLGKVRSRDRKADAEGIPLVWSADHKAPDWAFKVAHVETNELLDGKTPSGSWTVTTGPRRIIPVACSSKNVDLLSRCRKPRSRTWCGGWHPIFRPITGLVVDDLAKRVPSGELVRLDTHTKQGVILVSASNYELWQNDFASQVGLDRNHVHNIAKRCTYQPSLSAPICAKCNKPLFLIRPGRVICERCRIDSRLREESVG